MDNLGLIEPFNMSVQVLTIFFVLVVKLWVEEENHCLIERICQRPLQFFYSAIKRKLTKI